MGGYSISVLVVVVGEPFFTLRTTKHIIQHNTNTAFITLPYIDTIVNVKERNILYNPNSKKAGTP